jgi:replicative DNA helicase
MVKSTNKQSNVALFSEESSYKKLPHNLEAEQALLGALLVDNRAQEQISDFLIPEHFYHPQHQKIYEAISRIIERGQLATPVTLKTFLDNQDGFDEIGGINYIIELANNSISILHAGEFGRTIHDLYLRRQLMVIGEGLSIDASEPKIGQPATDLIEHNEKKLFDLTLHGQTDRGLQAFSSTLKHAIEITEAAFKRDSQLTGISSGFFDLDKQMGGLHPSDLIIIAGRPSMGKTIIATNMAFNAARSYKKEKDENGTEKVIDGGVVAFFSLEMSAEQLATRIISECSEISSENIRKGDLSHDDFKKIVEATQTIANIPLYIDDTPAITVNSLRTRARRLKRQKGLSMIVVDYLQLMRGDVMGNSENRVLEISEITRGLKAIAKELQVPVIALSQLSRAVEQREDKRPQLSDLRESGSIEQDADVVMMLYREEYYLSRAHPTQMATESTDKFNQRYANWQQRFSEVSNIAEIIIAKQRHGPIGNIRLHFDGSVMKFANLMDKNKAPHATR